MLPHQLTEFIGQLLDHHTQTLQLLEHADQVLAGEATDHLQVCRRTSSEKALLDQLKRCAEAEFTFGFMPGVLSSDGRGAVEIPQDHRVTCSWKTSS